MDLNQYSVQAIKTATHDYPAIRERVSPDKMLQVLHGSIGLSTEANEILDAVKAHVFYGKPLSHTNLLEELGDSMWFINLMREAYGFTWDQIMRANISKLATRFPDLKFTDGDAIYRNLHKEHEALKGATQ